MNNRLPEEKVMSDQEMVDELKRIQKKAVEANCYNLCPDAQQDLTIILNTLFYILDCAKKNTLPLGVPENTAVIHIENHYSHQKENLSPSAKKIKTDYSIEEVNESLKAHLVMAFIKTFNIVENAGPKYVQEYCRDLGGECIDGRTRNSFSYAWKLSITLGFCIQDAHSHVPKKLREKYFPLMAQVIRNQ